MSANVATGLAITNPLIKYRALIATKTISPDPSQYRLAIHLQKLYDRLKDYEPQVEYSQRLDQISRAVASDRSAGDDTAASVNRRSWRSLIAANQKRNSLALTRRFTDRESAMQMTSPKGLMVHGEVGTGKSMLIDLFADCLPNRKKRRWHFNTFMLETFAKLEALRRQRASQQSVAPTIDEDHSLLWVAKDLVQTSPILFLDEFQLPDRAASKILTSLMTSFFHLGGVLIATSNRMPEELAKASGVEFAPPPSRLESLGWQLGLVRKKAGRGSGLFGGQSEFAAFLEVLKARCEVWEMEGRKDYRRTESQTASAEVPNSSSGEWQLDGHDDLQNIKVDVEQDEDSTGAKVETPGLLSNPANYLITNDEAYDFQSLLERATNMTWQDKDSVPWNASVLKVYGRMIPVPRACEGISLWTFEELCKTNLGPADYTSLASNYHTIIVDRVPVMTWLMKNEARRFITLLDALYECRCKLLIRAEAGPDEIFFPEKTEDDSATDDAVYSETLSEVYQDVTAPFRPNILMQNPNYAEPDAEPDYTHARLAGLLNADALEDDPPNKPRRNPFGRSFGRTDSEMERGPIDPDEQRYTRPNFANTSAFTGEDERFAYKRAQSRLWEMCSAQWWSRNERGWHRPLPVEVRRWERSTDEADHSSDPRVARVDLPPSDVSMGSAVEDSSRDERSFRQSASPFRTSSEPPPKISWTHVWGTMVWGKKAGAWGRGVEGLKDRGNEKR